MNPSPTTRRQFVRSATSLAAVSSLAALTLPAGAEDRPPLRVGVIGCGGRGTFLAKFLQQHGGYKLCAAADYFPDRVQELAKNFGVPADACFTGLQGYRQLLERKELDAVVISCPPAFHPEHAEAAIAAGKHVFLAKPVAVDVPGCKRMEAAGKQAAETGRVLLVDFQTRSQPLYMEAVRRVQAGAIGDLTFCDARYHRNRLDSKAEPDGSPEARLRNWVFDIALSGDILVEQHVHALDVVSWLMQTPPVEAVGTCGRKVRTDVGDCNDHFALHFRYPKDIGVTFTGKQYSDGAENSGLEVNMFGSEGRLVSRYGGQVLIYGKNFYRGGKTPQIYTEGAIRNLAEFHRCIRTGDARNPTFAPSLRSTLVTLLGREAAYTKKTVRWEALLKSEKKLDPQLDGLKG